MPDPTDLDLLPDDRQDLPFVVVDQADVPRRSEWLDADIAMAVRDAARRDARSVDVAVANVCRVVREWLPDGLSALHVLQPLLSLDLDLTAFHLLRSRAAEARVASDVSYVYRFAQLGGGAGS